MCSDALGSYVEIASSFVINPVFAITAVFTTMFGLSNSLVVMAASGSNQILVRL